MALDAIQSPSLYFQCHGLASEALSQHPGRLMDVQSQHEHLIMGRDA